MKSILIHSLLVLGCTIHLSAQCPQFPVVLTTQQEVDSFRTKYPGCDSLTHPLTIEGSLITSVQPLLGITYVGTLYIVDATNLQSLSGFDSLRKADILVIWNTGLLNFQGLEALDTVELYFQIVDNPQLQHLGGLNNLRSVHEFWLSNNPQLQHLVGLNNLRSVNHLWLVNNSQLISLQGLDVLSDVGVLDVDDNPALQHLAGMPGVITVRTLIVNDNPSLTSLSGLENINHITNNLYIRDNPALTSIEALYQVSELDYVEIKDNPMLSSLAGLDSLNMVNREIILSNNDALVNLDGLRALQRVTGDLVISNNDALVNLDGLSALERVTDTFEIAENGALVNLSGITSLQYVRHLIIHDNDAMTSLEGAEAINYSIESINIAFNEVLSSCAVESICGHLRYERPATIEANFDGCNSQAQVLEACLVATDDGSERRLLVYPNPTNDLIHVAGIEEEVFGVEVWNAVGIRFPDMELKHGQLDMSGLQTGLYLVRIPLQTGMEQFPIIRL